MNLAITGIGMERADRARFESRHPVGDREWFNCEEMPRQSGYVEWYPNRQSCSLLGVRLALRIGSGDVYAAHFDISTLKEHYSDTNKRTLSVALRIIRDNISMDRWTSTIANESMLPLFFFKNFSDALLFKMMMD